jgi:hypothetical protein
MLKSVLIILLFLSIFILFLLFNSTKKPDPNILETISLLRHNLNQANPKEEDIRTNKIIDLLEKRMRIDTPILWKSHIRVLQDIGTFELIIEWFQSDLRSKGIFLIAEGPNGNIKEQYLDLPDNFLVRYPEEEIQQKTFWCQITPSDKEICYSPNKFGIDMSLFFDKVISVQLCDTNEGRSEKVPCGIIFSQQNIRFNSEVVKENEFLFSHHKSAIQEKIEIIRNSIRNRTEHAKRLRVIRDFLNSVEVEKPLVLYDSVLRIYRDTNEAIISIDWYQQNVKTVNYVLTVYDIENESKFLFPLTPSKITNEFNYDTSGYKHVLHHFATKAYEIRKKSYHKFDSMKFKNHIITLKLITEEGAESEAIECGILETQKIPFYGLPLPNLDTNKGPRDL